MDDYKDTMTEFELLTEVQKNYKSFLDIDKALAIFELENGYRPDIIIEDPNDFENGLVVQETIDKINEINGNDFCTVEAMVYMKKLEKLQESGECNMIAGDVRARIQSYLLVDYIEASVIHHAYIEHYSELYRPETTI